MTDYVIMPKQDYEEICDAVRDKTGKTDLLTSGDLAAEIEGMQTGGGAEGDLDLLATGQLPTVDLPTATSLPKYFLYNTNGVKTVNAPNVTTVGDYAFDNCRSITTVNFPKLATIGSSVFDYCTELKSISVPSLTSMGSYAFTGCGMESISLPVFTGSLGNYAFQSCAKLKTVDLPKVNIVNMSAFKACTALKTIVLPSGNQAKDSAFYGCTNLVLADFRLSSPPSSPAVGSQAFRDCTSLKAVVMRQTTGTYYTLSSYAFSNTPIASGEGYIYLPSARVDYYKSATNWSTYADQIRAIEDYTVDGTVTGELDYAKMGIEVTE